jgi:biopolymer transport protein ExbD
MASRHESKYQEVDLTPLLDLVLQMVMFFMVCANFASQQLSMNVRLAHSRFSQEVQPQDDKDSLVINIEVEREEVMIDGKRQKRIRQPKVIVVNIFGNQPIKFWEAGSTKAKLKAPGEDIVEQPQGLYRAQGAIRDIGTNIKRVLSERQGKPFDEVKIPLTVVLRADREARTGVIHQIMSQCKAAGFPRVDLGTLQERPAPSR